MTRKRGPLLLSKPYSWEQTWNAAGVAFVGADIQITDTASAAGSLPFRIRGGAAGTTGLFSVSKAGQVAVALGTVGAPALVSTSDATTGLYWVNGTTAAWSVSGSERFRFNGNNFLLMQNAGEIWFGSSQDVRIGRDAANVLALRNDAAAQAFNVYNTYTSGSVYERGFMRWASNVLEIGTEHAGATNRDVTIVSATGVLNTPATIKLQGSSGTSFQASGSVVFHYATEHRMQSGAGSYLGTSGTFPLVGIQGTWAPTGTSTMVAIPFKIEPIINYSNGTPGAGSYEAFKIAVTETALPTGQSYLIRAAGGAAGTTDRFNVLNNGDTGIGKLGTLTSFLSLAAGTTAKSQVNLASSTAPTSPVDGDIWFDGTNIFIRVAGATKTFTII